MVVTVVTVRVMQVAAHPVIDVRPMGNRRVPAAGAVLVGRWMHPAFMARLALLGVGVADGDDVVIHVVTVLVVEVAVMEVVLVPVMQDFVVATAVGVVVFVFGMLLARFHGTSRQSVPLDEDPFAAKRQTWPPLAQVVTGPLNLRRHRSSPPVHAPWADARLDDGIRLYNEGHHWHAHECWEPLWMGLEDDDKLFVQGLIMSAAMLHQYARRVPRGVANHWDNVTFRLEPHRPDKWGIDVEGLLRQLAPFARAAQERNWSLSARDVQIHRTSLPATD